MLHEKHPIVGERKKITLQDMLALVESVQLRLPHLDRNNPDHKLLIDELLWKVNCVGAAYEYQKGVE